MHYLVYFDDAPSPDDSTLLETRKEEVHEFSNWIVQRKLMDKKNAAPLTQAEHPPRGEDDDEEEEEEEVKEWYCWHRERFQLDVAYCEDAKRWCLKGRTRFGDAMDDEWMLVFVLFQGEKRCYAEYARANVDRARVFLSLFIVAVFTCTLSLSLSLSLSQTLTFILSFLIRARGMCCSRIQ